MPFSDTMLSKSAVAQMLGCSERSLERMVRRRTFPPALRFGKECLWFESVVHAWLEARRAEQLDWQNEAAAKARASKSPRAGGRTRTQREADDGPSVRSVFTAEQLVQAGRHLPLEELQAATA